MGQHGEGFLPAMEIAGMVDDKIRVLLKELASGDEQAAQTLWDRYFTKIDKGCAEAFERTSSPSGR